MAGPRCAGRDRSPRAGAARRSNGTDQPTPFLAVGKIRTPELGDTGSLGAVLRDMLATSLGSIPGLRVVANSRLIELMPRGADALPGRHFRRRAPGQATEILEGELIECDRARAGPETGWP